MQVRKRINASTERVWDILINTQLWPEWGPSVQAVDCSQSVISAGVSGRIKTAIGIWVAFTITEFEPVRFWGWNVAGFPATGHRLEKIDDANCDLVFELPLVAFPYALICHQAARRIARIAEEKTDEG